VAPVPQKGRGLLEAIDIVRRRMILKSDVTAGWLGAARVPLVTVKDSS